MKNKSITYITGIGRGCASWSYNVGTIDVVVSDETIESFKLAIVKRLSGNTPVLGKER